MMGFGGFLDLSDLVFEIEGDRVGDILDMVELLVIVMVVGEATEDGGRVGNLGRMVK
jgi:hypothetical protein